MDLSPLQGFRSLSFTTRLAAEVGLVFALALTVTLQRWQMRLKDEESQVWWASNGRDVLNLGSWGAIGLAMVFIGFPFWSAMVLSGTILIVLNLLENALVTRPNAPFPAAVLMGVALALALPVMVVPAPTQATLEKLAAFLF